MYVAHKGLSIQETGYLDWAIFQKTSHNCLDLYYVQSFSQCLLLVFLVLSTLFGMGGDTFIPLSFLDWILSAKFISKISKLFLEVKIDINRVDLTPCQAH